MTRQEDGCSALSRRTLVGAIAAGAAVAGSRRAIAQAEKGVPPTVVTSPPRQFGPNAPPNVYLDPDIVIVDPVFTQYVQGNAPIQRLWTGALWSEGPAWSGQGRSAVWSDIPNNRQLRWLGQVSVFRAPSNNSNGNTFDFQGRQISCEHLTRRVVRYEHDGSVTVIADAFNGKRLNSPNDVVPHPDGSIWFTDPPYGGQLYEGEPDVRGARATRRAGSIRGLASRVGSSRGSANSRPMSTAPTPAGGSTSSSPRTSSPTRTGWCSRRITKSST
jgi:gluconolactonase